MTATATPEPGTRPLMVSVDDHVVEPPDLWVSRLPSALTERGPRVVREQVERADGESVWGDVWHYEDVRVPMMATYASAGMAHGDVEHVPITYDALRPGCYEQQPRLADMDLDGVEVSMCFPNMFVRFCGQRFLEGTDQDLALLCVQAYNDFLVDEWEAGSGGRLLGAGIVPLWDAHLAAAEVRRVAARGLKSICFSELPTKLGLPSLYTGKWEPFLEACEATNMLISLHIGSSSSTVTSSDDAPLIVGQVNHFTSSSLCLTDWIVSGALARHRGIRLLFAEAQAGWIPFTAGRLDAIWSGEYKFFEELGGIPELPSSYIDDHVFACITNDPAALAYVDRFGLDHICYETDYPHPDSAWPNSRALADKLFGGLTDEQYTQITRTNALRILGLS